MDLINSRSPSGQSMGGPNIRPILKTSSITLLSLLMEMSVSPGAKSEKTQKLAIIMQKDTDNLLKISTKKQKVNFMSHSHSVTIRNQLGFQKAEKGLRGLDSTTTHFNFCYLHRKRLLNVSAGWSVGLSRATQKEAEE